MLLIGAMLTLAPSSFAASDFGPTEVVAIQNSRTADLVVLNSGFSSGLRLGMICVVSRESVYVGSVMLVELRSSYSAALIVGLSPRRSLSVGDHIEIKIL